LALKSIFFSTFILNLLNNHDSNISTTQTVPQ
jgi:hypothetical protein